MEPEASPDPTVAEKRQRSVALAVALLVVAIVGGILVTFSYLSYSGTQAKKQSLPKISRLEENLVATERSGEKVELKNLRGKVLLIGHIYTQCPRGCSGLAEIMKSYQKQFGKDENFQLLSFTVDPTGDGPEQLREFTKTFDIEGDNWWFLTDQEDPDALENYLTSQLRFEPITDVPEAERLNDYDLFQHDMRLGLVDHQGNVRGLYQVLNASAGELINNKLAKDIKTLLNEAKEGGSAGIPPVVFYAIVLCSAAFIIGVSILGKKTGA